MLMSPKNSLIVAKKKKEDFRREIIWEFFPLIWTFLPFFARPRAIALGSKPPLVTRIARTGLGTRLRQSVFFSLMNKTKGGSARRVKDAKVFQDLSSYTEVFFYTIYYIKAKSYNLKHLLIILLEDTKSYGGRN